MAINTEKILYKNVLKTQKGLKGVLKKNKILNFASAVIKKKGSVSGKIVEMRMQRDLFGHPLRISLEKTLDIDKVLSCPLTPIPFSLCHVDGSICKTDKSALFKLLEKLVDKDHPACDYNPAFYRKGKIAHSLF